MPSPREEIHYSFDDDDATRVDDEDGARDARRDDDRARLAALSHRAPTRRDDGEGERAPAKTDRGGHRSRLTARASSREPPEERNGGGRGLVGGLPVGGPCPARSVCSRRS